MKKSKKHHSPVIVMSNDTDFVDPSTNKQKETNITNTNQLFFYEDVSRDSVFTLNKNLDDITKNILYLSINYNLQIPPPIELYICSDGGDIFSAFSSVDRIKSNKVPVHSYVEGVAASAATLLSVCAHKRYIRKNSFMLIHQLKSEMWGSFSQFKDEIKNLELIMSFIKRIYLEHTNFKEEELDTLLKHDIYLNSQQCLEKGLVDVILK